MEQSTGFVAICWVTYFNAQRAFVYNYYLWSVCHPKLWIFFIYKNPRSSSDEWRQAALPPLSIIENGIFLMFVSF